MLLNCGVEKALESPLDCKDMKPLHPKGNQSWIFIERTDAETEAPILCPLDAKNWLTGKDPDAGKDWRQEEKGMTEDEMAGWHHQLDGHVFEQTLGVGDGLEGLACCSPWGRKELDMTEQLNWTDVMNIADHKLSLWIRVLLLAGRREMNWRRQLAVSSTTTSSNLILFPTVPWLTSVLWCASLFYVNVN